MKKSKLKKNKGQAIVEYIIIIVIVAIAALTVMGLFSDRIRSMFSGVYKTLGGEEDTGTDTSSVETLQGMDADGLDDSN